MYNNKICGLVIPTRYKSERLPGKVLIEIAGKPQIEWIIERSLNSQYIDKIILATSSLEGNEILSWYHKSNIREKYNEKVWLYFGSHDDLMERTLKAIQFHGINIVVSASHDLTFIDPTLIDICIKRLFDYNADFSCNYITRSFVDGFDIGVHTREIYERVNAIIPKDDITRMWTAWNIFYWREKLTPKPRIINLEASPNYYFPEWRLSLDMPEDKVLIEHILDNFSKFCDPLEITNEMIIDYLKCNPKLLEINKSIQSTELLQEEINR